MLKTPVGTYNNLDGDWKFKLNVELSTKFEGFPATVICSLADVTSVMLIKLQYPLVKSQFKTADWLGLISNAKQRISWILKK